MEIIKFKRAGLQPDGTCIQKISRKTPDAKGSMQWLPPDAGQRIATQAGPFEVTEVTEVFKVPRGIYFRAKGRIIE